MLEIQFTYTIAVRSCLLHSLGTVAAMGMAFDEPARSKIDSLFPLEDPYESSVHSSPQGDVQPAIPLL